MCGEIFPLLVLYLKKTTKSTQSHFEDDQRIRVLNGLRVKKYWNSVLLQCYSGNVFN